VPRLPSLLRALLPFALYGLAREIDAALGLLLHTSLDVPGLVALALGQLGPSAIAHVAAWVAVGAAAWLASGAWRARRSGLGLGLALDQEAAGWEPLYLRPAVTALALVCVALRPAYPYLLTLPVALTQDWGPGQDAAAAAALVALRLPRRAPRLPAPSVGALFFMAFLAYALITPEAARTWQGHPGNEPKYLRMGLSLATAISLDVEAVSALPDERSPLETLAPKAFVPAVGTALRGLGRESLGMLAALAHGPRAVGAAAIRAQRLARQTVAGKEGGIFHVLAPGPSMLLAPTLRLDRALNLRHGTPGRLAVSVLAWNALAAALIAAIYLLLCDVTGRPGLAAALAAGLGLTPPFLFYAYQFYPEMPGALLLIVILRALLFARRWRGASLLGLGLMLAALPWLHQKFLPVWGVLVVMAIVGAVDALVTLPGLLALLVPQVVSLYLTALYNFGITGSPRPDALFLAWGPGGVASAHVGEGVVGLLLDARYGLVPYAPLYLLAAGGVAIALQPDAGPARRLLLGAPAVVVYYLTVAAADNWSGSVCNLGRYIMPAVPFLAALVAVGLGRSAGRRGVWTIALTLGAWTGLLAVALWRDPQAANDSALLLARSAIADGDVYIPNLFFRSWNYGAPGQTARMVAWLVAAALSGWWMGRAARGYAGGSALRALAGLAAVALLAAVVLERWPSPRRTTHFVDRLEVTPGVLAFVTGGRVMPDRIEASTGDVDVLVRARAPQQALRLLATGSGVLRVDAAAPIVVAGRNVEAELPLRLVASLTGRRGASESLEQAHIVVEGRIDLCFRPE
jgi:hypothetical protein